jgi:hypothetical protein
MYSVINNLQVKKYGVFLLVSHPALQLYHIEVHDLPEHPVTAAMLNTAVDKMHCVYPLAC